MTEHKNKLNGHSQPPSTPVPTIVEEWPGATLDAKHLLELYNNKDYNSLCERILEIFEYFKVNNISSYTDGQKNLLNMVVKLILLLLSKEDFSIPEQYITYFIQQNQVISNLALLCDYQGTDLVLGEVLKQKNNFFKILTLCSARNKADLEMDKLFSINPYLTSLWIAMMVSSRWNISRQSYENMQKILTNKAIVDNYILSDNRFPVTEDTAFAFFHATYAAPDHDLQLRQAINKRVRQDFNYKFENKTPDFKKILVVSRSLTKTHAVYKSISPLLYSLKDKYHLTLFHLYDQEENFDTELFDEIKIIRVDAETNSFTYQALENNLKGNYGTIIFTDIGLNRPSIILSNFRMAPIQITTYGHPVSTHGAEIDYYIGGQSVETPNNPQQNYSEKLVLIPGLAALPIYPDYTRKNPVKSNDRIIISCSWGNQKFYYPHLLNLKKIIERTDKKVLFDFVGMTEECMLLPTAGKELGDLLGKENIRLHKKANYAEYMQHIEACHIAIDSFPFGSYNRIVDTLFCGIPIVTLEGEKAYNRLASAMLRELGLEELIATSAEEYVKLTLKCIEDDDYRKSITDKIAKLDLKEKLFNTGKEKYFCKAVDFLIRNHKALNQEKTEHPIIIE